MQGRSRYSGVGHLGLGWEKVGVRWGPVGWVISSGGVGWGGSCSHGAGWIMVVWAGWIMVGWVLVEWDDFGNASVERTLSNIYRYKSDCHNDEYICVSCYSN